MSDRRLAIEIILSARPANDSALFDSETRSAFERGFEQMRAIALDAVLPESSDAGWAQD